MNSLGLDSNLAEFTTDNVLSTSDQLWHKAEPWEVFQAIISEEQVIIYD